MLFSGASDGGIERGEHEVAVERRIETLDDEAAGGLRNRRVEMPTNGFGVSFAGGTLGGRDFREVKPRMIAENWNERLADDTGGTEDSGLRLLRCLLRRHVAV